MKHQVRILLGIVVLAGIGCARPAASPAPQAASAQLTNAEALPPMPLPEDRMSLSAIRTFEDEPAATAPATIGIAAPATTDEIPSTREEAKAP